MERLMKPFRLRSSKDRKPLSEEQKRKRAGFVVYPLMFLLCLGSFYLIFSPSGQERERQDKGQGFNTEIPSPEDSRLEGNKKDAYEKALMEQESRKRKTFFETAESMFAKEERKDCVRLPDNIPPERQTHTETETEKGNAGPVSSSAGAYREMNRTLGSIYEPRTDPEKERLQERIEELERMQQQQQKQEPLSGMEEKMALMEKSYELAAKYMNGQNGQSVPPQPGQIAQVAPSAPVQGKGNAIPVKSVSDRTVSGLQQPMSNAEFIAEYGKPRNYGFNTAVGSGYSMGKNTIRACVHNDQTLMDGQTVKLRLLEPLQAGNVIVPKNSLVSGSAKVQGERLDILVSSLEYAGNIIPVELAVYDSDGQKGLSVPSSLEQEAAKEAMANIGAGLGTSISFAQSAGQQVAMDITRGLMQGSSQYLAKKFRTVKVHLKANYQVMLYAKQQ